MRETLNSILSNGSNSTYMRLKKSLLFKMWRHMSGNYKKIMHSDTGRIKHHKLNKIY
jgi:hypothetical protein